MTDRGRCVIPYRDARSAEEVMTIVITVEVHVPPDVPPTTVVDEITSNLESCDWTVGSMCYEITEGDLDAAD
jgi:hypothetical protein